MVDHPGTLCRFEVEVLDESANTTLGFLEFSPPLELSHWVEAIAFAVVPRSVPARSWRLIPDARTRVWIPSDGGLDPTYLRGTTGCRDIKTPHPGEAALIRFTPWSNSVIGNLGAHGFPHPQTILHSGTIERGFPARHDAIVAWLRKSLHAASPYPKLAMAWRALADPTIADVKTAARMVGVSPRTMRRMVRRASGCSAREARELERLRKVCRILRSDLRLSWTQAAMAAGYCDQSHLLRAFRRFVGMTPGRFFGEGHHHMNDVFAGRVRWRIEGCQATALGQPHLRPQEPIRPPIRDRRRFKASGAPPMTQKLSC